VQPVFRFAPSPNGDLHLGHAFSALTDYAACREAGGRFLLRIEDIDRARCRPEFERGIYDDLAWLGLIWEEPVRRQSEHLAEYAAALERLTAMGLTYPAYLSRAEIATATAAPDWPRDPDGAPLYPGDTKSMGAAERARHIEAGEPYALRLDMAAAISHAGPAPWNEAGQGAIAADPAAWGDVILARKEAPTSYHLAVVVDDAAQGVTDVVRGGDLFHSTSVHRLLQALLGLPAPRYRHHRLMLDADGKKLSKSTAATGLRELRGQGVTPEEIRRLVGLD
jgi:glutamyl-Q tRNA(Asp) synthetase